MPYHVTLVVKIVCIAIMTLPFSIFAVWLIGKDFVALGKFVAEEIGDWFDSRKAQE